VAALRGVGCPRCRSQPHIVFQLRRRRFRRPLRRDLAVVGRYFHINILQDPQTAVSDHLACPVKIFIRTLMGTGLKNPTISLDCIRKNPPFMDSPRQRLFAINILSGLDSRQRNRHMPVIGSGYDNRVNILTCQNFAEIDSTAIGFQAGFRKPRLKMAPIHIAHHYNLGGRLMRKTPQIAHAHSANADDAEGNPV